MVTQTNYLSSIIFYKHWMLNYLLLNYLFIITSIECFVTTWYHVKTLWRHMTWPSKTYFIQCVWNCFNCINCWKLKWNWRSRFQMKHLYRPDRPWPLKNTDMSYVCFKFCSKNVHRFSIHQFRRQRVPNVNNSTRKKVYSQLLLQIGLTSFLLCPLVYRG